MCLGGNCKALGATGCSRPSSLGRARNCPPPGLREQQPWGARWMPLSCPVGHGQASLFPGPARVVVLGVPRKRTKSSPASCGLWAPRLPGTWLPLRWGWAAGSTRLGPEDSLHSPQVEAPGRPGLGP